jgi:hypothetical protein
MKVGQKYMDLTRRLLQQRIVNGFVAGGLSVPSHNISDFTWRRIIRGIGVGTTVFISKRGNLRIIMRLGEPIGYP